MKETFKAIPSTNGRYQASNLGNIRRTPTLTNPFPKLLATQSNGRYGPLLVEIARQGRIGGSQLRSVGRLVLEAFLPARPAGAVARYVDGNPKNVNLHNLAWRPLGEAIALGRKAGLVRLAATLDGRRFNAIEGRLVNGQSVSAIASHFGVSAKTVKGVKLCLDSAISGLVAITSTEAELGFLRVR
jgi:hypothetical protein